VSLPPTLRQLVDRVEVLEQEHDPRTVIIVPTVPDAEGSDADYIIIDGVAEADPDYQPVDRCTAVLGPGDEPVVDRSVVVEDALHRPRGVRHALADGVVRWLPRW
jgi:hypothetical protein